MMGYESHRSDESYENYGSGWILRVMWADEIYENYGGEATEFMRAMPLLP